ELPRPGAGGAVAREGAAEDLAHQRHARSLVLTHRTNRALPVALIGRRIGSGGPIEDDRVGAEVAVLVDQTARRHRLPALRRYQNLTLGDYRRGEVEQQRRIAWSRHSDAERSRGEAPVGSAERRHEDAAGGIDEVDRKSTRLNSSHVKISYAVFCLKEK